MVKYMFLLYGASETLPEAGTEEFARMRADWDAATGAMARAGLARPDRPAPRGRWQTFL